MASIRLENVTRKFGDVIAVDDVNLTIGDKEFLVLLGPSGCGKSTLLRLLAGLEEVSEGSIWLGDRRVDRLEPGDRNMAFVFQSYALYPHMSVRKNVAFPLVMARFRWWFHVPIIGGVAKRRIRKSPAVAGTVARVLNILGLAPLANKFPATLSGGQRQRVALARAMVRDPEAFLMDEPLSNLDAQLRTKMRSEITHLHRQTQRTFVYVTHDQTEAMTMGSRIVVMREGRVQQIGTPHEVFDSPVNVFVAKFVGNPPMNLVACDVVGPQQLRIGDSTLEVGDVIGAVVVANNLVGQSALLGVRPESLRLAADAIDGATRSLVGVVEDVEELGAEALLRIRVAQSEGATIPATDVDPIAADRELYLRGRTFADVSVGKTVRAVLDTSQLHLFNARDGRRYSLGMSEAPFSEGVGGAR